MLEREGVVALHGAIQVSSFVGLYVRSIFGFRFGDEVKRRSPDARTTGPSWVRGVWREVAEIC
jgi:hypothetical protein